MRYLVAGESRLPDVASGFGVLRACCDGLACRMPPSVLSWLEAGQVRKAAGSQAGRQAPAFTIISGLSKEERAHPAAAFLCCVPLAGQVHPSSSLNAGLSVWPVGLRLLLARSQGGDRQRSPGCW